MIVELGHFTLCLALVAAVIQSAAPVVGFRTDNASLLRLTDRASHVQLLGIGLAFAALTWAYVQSDFSLSTVALNSHSSKPLIYKISGVWANHEGSMLLWVLVLALFGAGISAFGASIPLGLRARVLSVQGMIGVGFIGFILLTSNPFARLAVPPIDGQGMNPLLQDPGVALHPPMLYLGYVGYSTAFSFAVAALWHGRVDAAWARWTRPWLLVAWAALTIGIGLGSWWAYYELGWGGFWFWDPVENASFMPWIFGTALLHSVIVVEKRDSLQKWAILLAILTFGLSLIGTFLVRSGILSSVHAFASDPERGVVILALLAIAIGGSLLLFALRAPSLADGGMFAPLSREGALVLNTVLLAAATGVVFVGTLYPLLLDMLSGDKVTVGAPYFNQTFVPLFAIVAVLAGIGPFLPWKRADARALRARLVALLLVTCLATGVLAAFVGWKQPLGLLGAAVSVWLLSATLADVWRRLRAGRPRPIAMLRRLLIQPRSAWGLWLGHGGLAIVIAGVTAVSVWQAEAIQVQKPGESVEVSGYQFTLMNVTAANGPNYRTSIASVAVERDGEQVALLFPERRWYPVEKKPTTEAGIQTLWHGDLYAVLDNPDGSGAFVTRYYYNPGVPWMWLGALVMALGALTSMTDRRLRVGAPATARRDARAVQT